MKTKICMGSDTEERNGELFIRVGAYSIRGGGFCWLPGEAVRLVKKRMDEDGKVTADTVFLIAGSLLSPDTIYPCRDFITFPGGDMAATLGIPLSENTARRSSDER